MHTQAESARTERLRPAAALSAATGLGLYLLTLIGEGMLGATIRWLLVWPLAAAAEAIVPLGLSPGPTAPLAALAPLAWSALALLSPGCGRHWARRLGARRPSAEEELAIDDALAVLRADQLRLPVPVRVLVLDDPLPGAAVRGRVLIVHRGLLEADGISAVLAHELGHLGTLDGRLTEALHRLELWGDPLGPPRRPGSAQALPDQKPESEPSLLWSCMRCLLRLAGGGCAEGLLRPLWSAYWRAREHAADAYAAALGAGEELARYLADYELPFDAPQRGLIFNRAEHPPAAYRIERLAALGGPN